MKLLNKKELYFKTGGTGLFNFKQISDVCVYIAGIPEIDELIGTKSFLTYKPIIKLIKGKIGIAITIIYRLKFYHVGIQNIHIKNIAIEKGNVIDVEKQSVLKRAVVGGLIAGPFGAIIGGMTAGNNVIKDNDMLVFTIQNGDVEEAILFEIKKGKTKHVYKFFKQFYPRVLTISN